MSHRLLGALCAAVVTCLALGHAQFALGATNGLVAAYSFDQSGTTVADLSGHGNVGTVSKAAWTSAGKYGGAYSFNGTSSMISVPDSPSLDLTTGMTIEAWVNTSVADGNWRDVVMKEQPG